jgi:hypothetical protein
MNYLGKYLEYTKEQEACELFHIWVALSTAAACLERKVWIHESFDHKIYPNLYVILVSPPGAGKKSRSIDLGKEFLGKIDGMQRPADKITEEALIQLIYDSIKVYQTPNGKPYTHCSVTVTADELEVFINAKAGEGIITLLTGLYQGYDRWEYRVKHGEPHIFHGSWLNVIAGTTPAFFQKRHFIEGCTGGFTSRVIFVWGLMKGRFINVRRDKGLESEILNTLKQVNVMFGEMKFDGEARQMYDTWYKALPKTFDVITELQHYYQRKGTHVLKIATILAAVDGNMTVFPEHLKVAHDILSRTEKELPRVFQSVGRSPVKQDIIEMQDLIRNAPGGEILLSELIAKTESSIPWDKFKDAIERFKIGGIIKEVRHPKTNATIVKWDDRAEKERIQLRKERKLAEGEKKDG